MKLLSLPDNGIAHRAIGKSDKININVIGNSSISQFKDSIDTYAFRYCLLQSSVWVKLLYNEKGHQSF